MTFENPRNSFLVCIEGNVALQENCRMNNLHIYLTCDSYNISKSLRKKKYLNSSKTNLQWIEYWKNIPTTYTWLYILKMSITFNFLKRHKKVWKKGVTNCSVRFRMFLNLTHNFLRYFWNHFYSPSQQIGKCCFLVIHIIGNLTVFSLF